MLKYTHKPIRSFGIIASLALFALSACGQGTPTPNFETLSTTESGMGDIVFDSLEPGIMVFAQPDDIDKLQVNRSPSNAEQELEQLDYSQYFALLALMGRKPTSGYSINITRITVNEDVISIYADFLELPENLAKATIITYPYHLVKIQKNKEWEKNITFNLIVDQSLVASASHFIP